MILQCHLLEFATILSTLVIAVLGMFVCAELIFLRYSIWNSLVKENRLPFHLKEFTVLWLAQLLDNRTRTGDEPNFAEAHTSSFFKRSLAPLGNTCTYHDDKKRDNRTVAFQVDWTATERRGLEKKVKL